MHDDLAIRFSTMKAIAIECPKYIFELPIVLVKTYHKLLLNICIPIPFHFDFF